MNNKNQFFAKKLTKKIYTVFFTSPTETKKLI